MGLDIANHPANWRSEELYTNTDRWQYRINDSERKELDGALTHLKSMETHSKQINKADFPLPTLQKKLKAISDFVELDYGIFLLRGIAVNDYSIADLKLLYAGIGSHLGTAVAQSKEGELIGDVGDTGKKLKEKTGRGTTTKDALPFHTDRCDIVTLFCLKQSKKGGQSRVVSALAIYEKIKKTRPDLIELLENDYYHARAAWETNGESTAYPLPIFNKDNGNFVVRYLRHFINVAQDIEGVPKMTAQQIEALNLVEQLADNAALCADMDFEPGDIQILNNFVSLHSRAGYEDDENEKRHLLRLWLSAPNSRPLTSSFKVLFGKVGAGEIRGGVPMNKHIEEEK
jgi:alpha-ketoglutarate-dependent taurine dioxygenase